MGSYIHKVPGSSHTSGATVRDRSHAAALLPGVPTAQGWRQTPCTAHGPPSALLQRSLPHSRKVSRMLRRLGRAATSLTSKACISVWWSQKWEQTPGEIPHRGHADLCLHTHTGGSPPKKIAEESPHCSIRARHPTGPSLQWRRTLCHIRDFSAGFLSHQVSCPSWREAALCTDMGKVAEGQPHLGCGAQQPPTCRKSHTG